MRVHVSIVIQHLLSSFQDFGALWLRTTIEATTECFLLHIALTGRAERSWRDTRKSSISIDGPERQDKEQEQAVEALQFIS